MSKKVTKRASANRKRKDTWTIAELQMWLTSVFDVQGDDWYPDQEQWNKVVDMIFKLKDTEVSVPEKTVGPLNGSQQSKEHGQPLFPQMTYGSDPWPNGNGQPALLPQTDPTQLLPLLAPMDNNLPEGYDNIEQLKRMSEAGQIGGGKVIKSAQFGEWAP